MSAFRVMPVIVGLFLVLVVVVSLMNIAAQATAVSLVPTGEVVIIDHTQGDLYSEEGPWTASGLAGFGGKGSRYLGVGEGWAKWDARILEPGWYRVYIYRLHHPTYHVVQPTEVAHAGGIDVVDIDFGVGPTEWVLLGTFEFSGSGDEYVKTYKPATATATTARANAVKFERLAPGEGTVADEQTPTGPEATGESLGVKEIKDPGLGRQGEPAVPGTVIAFATDVKELGAWTMDPTSSGALSGNNLRGNTNGIPGDAPALFELPIHDSGHYVIYLRTRDFNVSQGTRYFEIAVNGQRIPKTFGQHGFNGWAWEQVGPLQLPAGTVRIEVFDTSGNYARLDSIFLTNDLNLKPPRTREEALPYISQVNPFVDRLALPPWLTSDAPPTEVLSIKNKHREIQFVSVPTEQGTVIQKTTYIATSSGPVAVADRGGILAALLLYATDAKLQHTAGQFPVFDTVLTQDEGTITVSTTDVFRAGIPYWIVPSAMERCSDSSVLLMGSCEIAEVTWLWELPEDGSEPLVTATISPKVAGMFSLVVGASAEVPLDQTDFLLVPPTFLGKRFPKESAVVSDQYYSSPMALVTRTADPLGQVTTGIILGPESITLDWVRPETISHGFGIRGPQGGVWPFLVTPLLGAAQSALKPGMEYSITYRLVERLGDWYPAFKDVQTKVYGLTDYRKNYYGTLNDCIFNTWDLVLDDVHSGWDEEMKGFYNVEARTLVTQADPVALLSAYLLSSDTEMLARRVVPTLATLTTRESPHFTNVVQKPGSLPALSFNRVMPIGTPTHIFTHMASVCIYQLTRGLSGIFQEIGLANPSSPGQMTIGNPTFLPWAWRYQVTGNPTYGERAREEADRYIERFIDSDQTQIPDDASFIGIEYYPQFGALLDMYEIFGDQKYLVAAEQAARWLLTTVWSYQNPPADLMITIDPEDVRSEHMSRGAIYRFKGDTLHRVNYPAGLDELEAEEVPYWLVSRTGLSIEQISTYRDHRSGNIIMANWAPDLLRLGEYTGDSLFTTYARNAIIGRHTIYPGYYYTRYWHRPMQPDYPYTGPDLTGLYYHHIPPFLGMIQDFLFTQAWARSQRNIDFPSYRSYGYAYFSNRYYGGESGRFFEEADMWPWLKRGLVETDSVQINWIGARKDGVAGFAFMNEDDQDVTINVKLGTEVAPSYTGDVTVYQADGTKSITQASEGMFTITVPSKGLIAVTVRDPAIQAPPQARADYREAPSEGTVASARWDIFGKGMILQAAPDRYFAYVYVPLMQEELEKVTIHYRKGDAYVTIEDAVYPFEFVIGVDDPTASFTYYLELTFATGNTFRLEETTLVPKTAVGE